MALLAMLAVGVGMLLSALYVRFRDIQPIWEVACADPLLRLADHLRRDASTRRRPEPADRSTRAVTLNPIATMLTQVRHAFVDPSAPTAAAAAGGTARLLIPLAIIGGMFALGLWFFSREAPRIAENL